MFILDRKRKSTTGLFVIVVVGLLFYFLCSIRDFGGKVVPHRSIASTGNRIPDAELSITGSLQLRRSSAVAASLVRRDAGQTRELDMIQKDGYILINLDNTGDLWLHKNFSRTKVKMSKVRTREAGSNGVEPGSQAFGSRTRTIEPGLRKGDVSQNSEQSSSRKPESRSIMTSTSSNIESSSGAVKLRSNSDSFLSDPFQFRSKASQFSSGTHQGLDKNQPGSRTMPMSRLQLKDKFRFLIDASDVCDRRTLVLIIVCSAWENASRREVIRATWASLEDPRMRVLFLVGLPKQDNLTEDHQSTLEQESLSRRDLLQADFIDSYANLSLKSIAMLQWAESSCQPARFLFKADDDVLVNTPLLLRDLALTRHRRFVMGNVIAGARPSRDRTSKWFTPLTAYPRDFYPKYISGAAYVISGDLIRELYTAAVRAEVFWIEDVFITGLLLAARGSEIIDAQHIYNGKFDIQKEMNDPCSLKRHILRHLSDPTDMTGLWSTITSPSVCVTLT